MKWCTQKTTNSKRNFGTGRSNPSFEVSCTLMYNLIAWKPAVGISLTRRFLPKHHRMLWWDGLIRVFCIQSENKVHLHTWIHLSFSTNQRQDRLQHNETFSWNKIINAPKRSRGNINSFTTFKRSGWKCYKTIGSYVSCAFIEIWST